MFVRACVCVCEAGSVCDPAVLNGLTLVEGDRGTEIEAIERELNRR